MYWESLTTREFEALDRNIPVVLNIAAIEQHGPHLPVDVDVAIGWHLLDRLNLLLPDRVLVLPQIKVCCSAHHMSFAGTLSVSHEVFLAYAYDILCSVARHGFRNIVVLNSHGGNQGIGRVLIEKFGAAHPACRAVFATWWTMVGAELSRIRESARFGVGHACEFETSLMLLAKPEAVRKDLLAGASFVPSFDWANGDMLSAARALMYRPIADSSGGTGVLGDPSFATVDKGERITRAVVEQLRILVGDLFAAARTAAT